MRVFPRPVDILNAMTRRRGLTIMRNAAYGPHVRHRFDLYSLGQSSGPAPIIVFFHGGSWQSGAKEDYAFIGAALARAGFLVAVPDYRLYPNVQFPEFVKDAARATVWIARHAGEFGADPDALFVCGHSAGAYLALMLALNTPYLGELGFDRMRLAGAIGLAGPYDFLPLQDPALKAVFATASDPAATQPVTFADDAAPPVLLLTGSTDRSVAPGNSAALAARLRALGNVVETRVYPGIGHAGLLLSLTGWRRRRAPVLRDIRQFLNASLDGSFEAGGIPAARYVAG